MCKYFAQKILIGIIIYLFATKYKQCCQIFNATKHIHPLFNFSKINFSKKYLTENKFGVNYRIFFGFTPKFRRLEHFIKTQNLSFRFFCRFRQGVWHSVRGSQGGKLLLKIRKYLIGKPSRSIRPARLFSVLKSFS